MSTDPALAAFEEESREMLAEMERSLLEIEANGSNSDLINAIFRAAHSMKGGAGTFGFTDMTGVAHVLETLLDRVRKNELALTSEMVDAFLQAGDVIKSQLDAHRGGGELADTGPAQTVCARLEKLAASDAGVPKPAVAVPQAKAHGFLSTYHIAFSTAAAATAVEPALQSLRALGELEIVAQPKPRKRGKAPQRWELTLIATAAEAQLREAFEFLGTQGAVEIALRMAVPLEAAAPAQAAETAVDAGFGFFDEAPGVPKAAEDAGYGFFGDLPPAAPEPAEPAAVAAPSPGRRYTDQPAVTSGVAGRRDTDKVVVAPQGETSSIRVSIEKVDTLINLVGELVITQAMLAQNVSQLDPVLNEKLLNGMAQLDRNTRELQESVM